MINKKYGYVKLYRDFINWEWYSEPNTFRVFLHCLLCANHITRKWQGITIKAGSYITSLSKLADELSLTTQQVRTALKRLVSTNQLTYKSTSKYSIITINEDYICNTNDTQTNNQITNKQQTTNKQITTTNKEYKEYNEKNENYNIKNIFKELEEKLNK